MVSLVRVELGPQSKDRYGRLLYYVYTQDGDSIDEILVSEVSLLHGEVALVYTNGPARDADRNIQTFGLS